MSYRIAIGGLVQESNSFSPGPTTVETFRNCFLYHGRQLLTDFGDNRMETPGFLSVLQPAGVDVVPLLAGLALSSGPLTRAAFEELVGELEDRLRHAGPIDALLIALHGAMMVEDETDADGEILERLRNLLGPDTPIGCTLDLHGDVTPRMLQPNTFLIGYQDYPHTDIFETGQRAARMMLRVLAGEVRPVMALAKRPLILSPSIARTTDGPFKRFADQARQAEADGYALHASLFAAQPWIDIPSLGFAALVCADGDAKAAQALADELADAVWAARTELEPNLTTISEAIRIGLSSPGLTVVSDGGDAPTAGSAADHAGVLRALLAEGADRAERQTLVTLCDPAAVEAATRLGVGREGDFSLGHGASQGEPVQVRARVRALTDGDYAMRDQKMAVKMGLTAVLAIGSISVVVRSFPSIEWDVGGFTSQGLDPREAALVFVKSPSAFRHSFGPIAERILIGDTPGAAGVNLRAIPYRHVTRPIYPLDNI